MFLSSSTLASLRFFDVAARLLSFKQAAVELHITQGAVSQQIKNLERSLGCRLFYRLPRQLALTEEGQRFAAVVARALSQIEDEARSLAATRASIDIRLRAGPSFALRWLVPRLGAFYVQHPNIKLFITGAYGYFDPSRREFDLAVEMIKGRLTALHSEVLMKEHLVPVCSPSYLSRHPFLKRPKDVARCTLLHDAQAWDGASRDAEWRHWLRQVGARTVDSGQGQFFSLANMSIEAALTDQGIAMGRASLITDLLGSGRLVAPFKHSIESPVKYCLVYPEELGQHPGIQSVIRWLHEQVASDRARSAAEAVPR